MLNTIIGAFEERNLQKTATNKEEKSAFHQDNALCQVYPNNCKTT